MCQFCQELTLLNLNSDDHIEEVIVKIKKACVFWFQAYSLDTIYLKMFRQQFESTK